MKPLLGCIADDFTGATDLASMLREGGMRVVQFFGIPDSSQEIEADALIVALKSRSIPKSDAERQSVNALQWLKDQGCSKFYFKYCSTFDSTEIGNIGPVIETLLEALDIPFTIACPSYPENGRTVFNGHLFVGHQLLSESGMRHHPLNPMTDSNLVRFLQKQTELKVGLLEYKFIKQGHLTIKEQCDRLSGEGTRIAIADTITDDDLLELAEGCGHLPLLTGGSGLAQGLPSYYEKQGLLKLGLVGQDFEVREGYQAVISGSCSNMTLQQVERMKKTHFSIQVEAEKLHNDSYIKEVIDQAVNHLDTGAILIYSSTYPEKVTAIQEKIGIQKAGLMVEDALASIATALVKNGVSQLVIAGGETSGAVVKALGIQGLEIGPVIAPGVPWTKGLEEPHVALALKSGNFGQEDFFLTAFEKIS